MDKKSEFEKFNQSLEKDEDIYRAIYLYERYKEKREEEKKEKFYSDIRQSFRFGLIVTISFFVGFSWYWIESLVVIWCLIMIWAVLKTFSLIFDYD